jgi:hypothetical protein
MLIPSNAIALVFGLKAKGIPRKAILALLMKPLTPTVETFPHSLVSKIAKAKKKEEALHAESLPKAEPDPDASPDLGR